MEFTGTFVGGARIDLESRKLEITVRCNEDMGKEWDKLRSKEQLIFTVKQYKKKRSLDANAYYWQLLSKLAGPLQVSKPYLHNLMLRKYGECEVIDGKMIYLVIPDNEEGARTADEAETYHIKPTSEVKFGADGTGYRTYLMLRGSSTYNTKEMSTLINGLVEDCKEQGIETLPPEELERMMQAYDQNWRKKHEEAV